MTSGENKHIQNCFYTHPASISFTYVINNNKCYNVKQQFNGKEQQQKMKAFIFAIYIIIFT